MAIKVGGYRNFKHMEDYELWTRLLTVGIGFNLQEKLLKYRVHGKQITSGRRMSFRMLAVGIIIRLLAFFRV